MPRQVSKETPLSEITLRKYEKPYSLTKRDLVKKLCLSFGLLQPGDSRDVMVDVLQSLLTAHKNKVELTSEEVRESVISLRTQYNLPMQGIAASNIRRQLLRLRDAFMVEKTLNKYRIAEFAKFSEIYEQKIKSYHLNSILERIKLYTEEIDKRFNNEDEYIL